MSFVQSQIPSLKTQVHPLTSLCTGVTEVESFVSVYPEISLRTVAEGDRSVHSCVPFQMKTEPRCSFQVEATEQEAHNCASGCKSTLVHQA